MRKIPKGYEEAVNKRGNLKAQSTSKRPMEGYSALLKIMATEIKAVGYYLLPTRMGKMKKCDQVSVGKDMAKQELSNTSERSVN